VSVCPASRTADAGAKHCCERDKGTYQREDLLHGLAILKGLPGRMRAVPKGFPQVNGLSQDETVGSSTTAKAPATSTPAPITGHGRRTSNGRCSSPCGTAKPTEISPARPPNEAAAAEASVMNSPSGLSSPTSTDAHPAAR